MNVHLRNFISVARAGIGNIHTDLCRAAGLNLRGIYLQVFKLESGVTQSVAERKKRLPGAERVATVCRRLVIVKVRQIADGMRKRNGQFPAGIDVAKQYIRRRRAALLSQIPAFYYRWNM